MGLSFGIVFPTPSRVEIWPTRRRRSLRGRPCGLHRMDCLAGLFLTIGLQRSDSSGLKFRNQRYQRRVVLVMVVSTTTAPTIVPCAMSFLILVGDIRACSCGALCSKVLPWRILSQFLKLDPNVVQCSVLVDDFHRNSNCSSWCLAPLRFTPSYVLGGL